MPGLSCLIYRRRAPCFGSVARSRSIRCRTVGGGRLDRTIGTGVPRRRLVRPDPMRHGRHGCSYIRRRLVRHYPMRHYRHGCSCGGDSSVPVRPSPLNIYTRSAQESPARTDQIGLRQDMAMYEKPAADRKHKITHYECAPAAN